MSPKQAAKVRQEWRKIGYNHALNKIKFQYGYAGNFEKSYKAGYAKGQKELLIKDFNENGGISR